MPIFHRSQITPIFIILASCASTNNKHPESADQKQLEDVIPVTMANMRGHQALYDEGWFVITSSEDALIYAKQKSIISSQQAATIAANSIAARNTELKENLSKHWTISTDLGKKTYHTGSRITQSVLDTTENLSTLQVDYGTDTFTKAWGRFIKGNLHIGQRTQATRETLINQPGKYFSNLKQDFSNIYEITSGIQDEYSFNLGATWESSFAEASDAFTKEYDQSGESSNAISGLLHILTGYAKGLYHGLFKPGAETTVDTATVVAGGAAQVVFLPASALLSVSGRTIEAVGSTVFYTGKLGIEIISPTVEAGLLSGLSILSLGTAPLTYVTGTAVGVVNQAAFTAAAPVAAAGSGITMSAVDTGKYVTFVSYDAIAGTSKVVINQASAAVVLGYNALTALPAHSFMAVADSAVFLAYDGPRLVIAYAKGEISSSDGKSVGLDSLPIGSVVDLNALADEGIEVNVLSDDAAVINKVLEALPGDLRE